MVCYNLALVVMSLFYKLLDITLKWFENAIVTVGMNTANCFWFDLFFVRFWI